MVKIGSIENPLLKKVGRGRDSNLVCLFVCLFVTSFFCEHFWVNKSLSMMCQVSSFVYSSLENKCAHLIGLRGLKYYEKS
jgi:hypothetical protein